MSCIFGGFVAGPNAVKYAKNLAGGSDCERHISRPSSKRQEEINAGLMKSDGTENPFQLWRELGDVMTKNFTVIRYNKNLQQTDAKLVELLERFRNINLSDRTQWANTTLRLRAAAVQHAATGAGDRSGRGHARRIPRRALQAGLSRAR